MNENRNETDPTVYYYDGDYPPSQGTAYPENFDETTKAQGLAHDALRYSKLVKIQGDTVLELCCGSERIAIPLAKEGLHVTGVDISEGLLTQFKRKISRESKDVQDRVTIIHQDVTSLKLDKADFGSIIIAFNSLLCIPDFKGQCRALSAAAQHLSPTGRLIIDIVNPLELSFSGDSNPKAFYTRRNPHNGNLFTRFAMRGAFDENHCQKLYGWYDEILPEGSVKRQHYSMYWRPIFRFEIEMMLREAGLELVKIEGGHNEEPYTAQSPRMLIQAAKIKRS